MAEQPYPSGTDCVWLACDGESHVGAFVTAGAGPVAAAALSLSDIEIHEVEELALSLPKTGPAHVIVSVPRPDSFVALAERGLFVFDWQDAVRKRLAHKGAYEQMAAPSNPLTLDNCTPAVRSVAQRVMLIGTSFRDNKLLDVTKFALCRRAQ